MARAYRLGEDLGTGAKCVKFLINLASTPSMAVVPTAVELCIQAAVDDPVGEARWQSWFDQWLLELQSAGAVELTLRLTDDAEIRRLNARFRGVDAPTDVLSFEFEADDTQALIAEEPLYLGDIVVSVPTATRQAREFGHTLEVELAWLAVHGLLHLLGWDHPDEQSWRAMVTQQARLLKGVNVVYDWPSVYPVG
ncbi:gll1243 [Gloeobacter violaceus PCC 7421]|uniref:Endoribonuclease YbeY n=2 Tax=Gloeobacter violaceus TaxID=33072 RepID=YBEY_GLOVI|nr:RecName: Full=Endoribonuclease YbeY [Gloeobacter violaceus PCC 7421]BAC89184.1 gll1243 [Gloeobacter violaceus PCC 7421]